MNTEGFFADMYKNIRENSFIIMNVKGEIMQVSRSFTHAFGYTNKDLLNKHVRVLFTTEDKKQKIPETEVKIALAEGSKSDNNYLLHRNGTPLWVIGESVAVTNTDNEKYLVKLIHNIHAQKQLERYLLESTDFIDTIFDSIQDTALIILNSRLKVEKNNQAFKKMFGLTSMPAEGTKISNIENSFWKNLEIRKQLLSIIINRKPLKDATYVYKMKNGKESVITIDSKLLDTDGNEKKILLVIKNGPNPLPGV